MSDNDYKPLVSIGVPVYNGEEFLEECLNSILNQTYPNWVCNINNNASTDRSLEIAMTFVKKDSRFSVSTNDNFVELVPNWNLAYKNSNLEADYFKIVQADDWIYPEYLEKMIQVFQEDETITMTSSYRFDANRVLPAMYYDVLAQRVVEGKTLLIAHLEKKIDILGNVTTIMFANNYLKKIDRYPQIFDETSYHIDTELALELMDIGKIGFVPQILSFNRLHKKSGTSTVVYQIGTLYQHYDKILSQYKDYAPSIGKKYRENRIDFAYVMFMHTLLRNKKALAWHKKHAHKPLTTGETINGIITRNPVSKIVTKISNKVKGKFGG